MGKRRRTFIIKSKEKGRTMGRKQVESEYWICIMGGTHSKNLPAGADDITPELLEDLLNNYNVENISVIGYKETV